MNYFFDCFYLCITRFLAYLLNQKFVQWVLA